MSRVVPSRISSKVGEDGELWTSSIVGVEPLVCSGITINKAIQLVFGIVPMLIIAAIIEGFFSSNPTIPNPIKYLTGLCLFAILVMYFARKSVNSEQLTVSSEQLSIISQ